MDIGSVLYVMDIDLGVKQTCTIDVGSLPRLKFSFFTLYYCDYTNLFAVQSG